MSVNKERLKARKKKWSESFKACPELNARRIFEDKCPHCRGGVAVDLYNEEDDGGWYTLSQATGGIYKMDCYNKAIRKMMDLIKHNMNTQNTRYKNTKEQLDKMQVALNEIFNILNEDMDYEQ